MKMMTGGIMSILCSVGLVACTQTAPSQQRVPTPAVSSSAAQSTATTTPVLSPATTEAMPTPSSVSVAPAPPPSTAELPLVNSSASAQSVCAEVDQHQYEVCFAYLFNDTLLSRVPFYKSSRSQDPGFYEATREGCVGHTLGSAVTCRLWSRYYGSARTMLQQQTANWPKHVDVAPPHVTIDAVESNLATNSATIQTHENWQVTANENVLFAENNQPHTITLERVSGLVLHKWVVTSIR
jgi:hypothetical protein